MAANINHDADLRIFQALTVPIVLTEQGRSQLPTRRETGLALLKSQAAFLDHYNKEVRSNILASSSSIDPQHPLTPYVPSPEDNARTAKALARDRSLCPGPHRPCPPNATHEKSLPAIQQRPIDPKMAEACDVLRALDRFNTQAATTKRQLSEAKEAATIQEDQRRASIASSAAPTNAEIRDPRIRAKMGLDGPAKQ